MFNAIMYTQELEKAGFSREQAEASVRLLIATMNDNFATKSDLNEMNTALRSDVRELSTQLRSEMKELGTEIRSEMKELGTEIRGEMKELEYRLVTRLGTLMTALFGIAIAIIKIH
jgi:hypothetical protein